MSNIVTCVACLYKRYISCISPKNRCKAKKCPFLLIENYRRDTPSQGDLGKKNHYIFYGQARGYICPMPFNHVNMMKLIFSLKMTLFSLHILPFFKIVICPAMIHRSKYFIWIEHIEEIHILYSSANTRREVYT